MKFKGKKTYIEYVRSIIIVILTLFIAYFVLFLFSKRDLGLIFTIVYALIAFLYLFSRKLTLEIIIGEMVQITYVRLFKIYKLNFEINEKTRFYLIKEMVYRRSEPNFFIKILDRKTKKYLISSEDNFENKTILEMWDFIYSKYPLQTQKNR